MTKYSQERKWWKEMSVYQVWPASFCDSNGDGIGDLKGVESKLDHIKALSTDLIWLSPCFKSPQVDMGYDVSDYYNVHEAYGSLRDLEDLLAAAKERGIKMILDLVLNHCSEQHAWFLESRSSLTNRKRSWFHWRRGSVDPKTGEKLPPNNWESIFKGRAWEYDELTDEWYLHLFLKEQPDFNWENPEVREAMYDICRFWLDKGASGFRLDACQFLSKPVGYGDAPIVEEDQYLQPVVKHVAHGPRIHEYLQELNREVMSKYEHAYTVGETAGSNEPEVLLKYIRPERKELDTVFNFELAEVDGSHEDYVVPRSWKLSEFKEITSKWQREMIASGSGSAVYLENHDQARSVSRYASDLPEFRTLSAKLLAIHLSTLCGTVYIYQGQELGQINAPTHWTIDDYQDIGSKNLYADHQGRRRVAQGKEDVDMSDVVTALQRKSRDNARTPVQWTDDVHAGHSAKPWMRIHDDHKTWNATSLANDPDSVLNFYRRVFKIRKGNDLLIYGDYHLLSPLDEQIFAYRRDLDGHPIALVLLNFSKETVAYEVPELGEGKTLEGAKLVIGNYEEEEMLSGQTVRMKPYEGRIYLVK